MRAARAWCSGRPATSSTSPTGRSAAASTPGSRAATRRRPKPGDDNFITYCFSTDMQEEDIVFGGEKRLRAGDPGGLRHLPSQGDRRLLHLPGRPDRRRRPRRGPRNEGEARASTSSPSVARATRASASRPATTSPTTACSSTSSAWTTRRDQGKFNMNMLGEYNIGGDAFVIEDAARAAAASTLMATFSGNSAMSQVRERPHGRPQRA